MTKKVPSGPPGQAKKKSRAPKRNQDRKPPRAYNAKPGLTARQVNNISQYNSAIADIAEWMALIDDDVTLAESILTGPPGPSADGLYEAFLGAQNYEDENL